MQKNILAAASPYIRTKLNYNPPKDDGSTYKIELEGISVMVMMRDPGLHLQRADPAKRRYHPRCCAGSGPAPADGS